MNSVRLSNPLPNCSYTPATETSSGPVSLRYLVATAWRVLSTPEPSSHPATPVLVTALSHEGLSHPPEEAWSPGACWCTSTPGVLLSLLTCADFTYVICCTTFENVVDADQTQVFFTVWQTPLPSETSP